MDDTSGTTMTADVGATTGTYVNSIELDVRDASNNKWVGFDAATENPAHVTITTPLQSAAFTAMIPLQIDAHAAKHVVLTMGAGTVAGMFSIELVDDGASGLKPRVFSVSDTPAFVIYSGTATGTIPIGEPFYLFYVRRSNGTQEVWTVTASGTVSQIALTLDSGTAPGSWSAHPAGTWYVGVWSTGIAPLNGVARGLALWNVALSSSDIIDLGEASPVIQRVVSARALDVGEQEVNSTVLYSVATHVHPEVNFTLSVIDGTGTSGTLSTSGTSLSYAAGASVGTESGVTWRITKNSINSSTVAFTCELGAEPTPVDLPFFNQYYGSGTWSAPNPSNFTMNVASANGVSFFFFADRSGTVTQFKMHWRTYTGGYAAGNGGTYTASIFPANPTTKLPITTGSPICTVTGLNTPPTAANTWSNRLHTFTTQGALVAKQPYCFVFVNTASNPGANYTSCNIGLVHAFISEDTYREPEGINPTDVSSSITNVSGWSPVVIDGTRWYPWSCTNKNGINKRLGSGAIYLAYKYADDIWCGWGSIASQSGGHIDITGSNMVRDRFRVTRATRTVSGVFIRVTRENAATGNLVVTVESGPASDSSGNGTTLTDGQVTIPASNLYDVGPSEQFNENTAGEGLTDLVPFLWVPFSSNLTLELGTTYNIRFSKSGGSGTFDIWASQRASEFLDTNSVNPPSLSWDEWEDQRAAIWTEQEDSRGCQVTSNSGSTWTFNGDTARLLPYIFKCV
jgi:hypothetical protein